MPIRTKSVILDLLTEAVPHTVPARMLVACCALVGISETSTRVTLARLLAEGTIETTARGTYRLGSRNQELNRRVLAWRSTEAEMVRWDGAWACVSTSDLTRSDRASLRSRQRALRLLGFRELTRDLYVRPDNLRGGIAALRERLVGLGAERDAIIFQARFDEDVESRARTLWDGNAYNASYRATRKRLERWLAAYPRLEERAAAREAFLVGREVSRQILADPLLPGALVDVAERRALLATMRRLQDLGRRLWTRLFGLDLSPRTAPVRRHDVETRSASNLIALPARR